MWVFDGEQWTEEGGSAQQTPKTEPKQFDMDPRDMNRFLPELQVVEVVPVMPRTNHVPFTRP
ncbi:MAG: hypothetical protein NVSMB68_11660 [Thermoanaerobaculia bacterium]